MSMKRVTPEFVFELAKNEIFVFGSNLGGIHGAGAAKDAHEFFGAELGVGEGPTGQCYALPTKDEFIRTLRLREIEAHVKKFTQYIFSHPDNIFLVTPVGCGLAGYEPRKIAPMFYSASKLSNVALPSSFWDILGHRPS